jgi:CheY-like chemotaxis protein
VQTGLRAFEAVDDPHGSPPRKKIFLAASEPAHCRFEQEMLRRVGHTVITTSQMAEVAQLAKAEQVDLVVVDFYAPADARSACRAIEALRVDASLAQLPIILLFSPQADAQYHPRNWCPLAADACTYLRTPANPVELWALVDDPRPGDHLELREGPFVYRCGDWPEVE